MTLLLLGNLLLAFVTIVFSVTGDLEAASLYFLKPLCPTPVFCEAVLQSQAADDSMLHELLQPVLTKE